VSVDTAEESKPLIARLGLTLPVLSDPDRTVAKAYGVSDVENQTAWPAIFVLDSSGRVAWRSLSETYKLRPGVEAILEAVLKARNKPSTRDP
jgi:peroxiredoxin